MEQQPGKIFCLIRNQWVSSQPEEMVRQYWIQRMIEEWGYPKGVFALEKRLTQLPHLSLSPLKLPTRRADILVFAKGIHPQHDFYPLLLIECKAVALTQKTIRQAVGYNFYVQAPFIAVVNQTESRFGRYDKIKGMFHFESGMPSYESLLMNFPYT